VRFLLICSNFFSSGIIFPFYLQVPILEALELGFNVIFLDVDIALVRDPLPFLTQGDADFIVSPELRVCDFPSFRPQHYDWNALEPNTGQLIFIFYYSLGKSSFVFIMEIFFCFMFKSEILTNIKQIR
jgi:hypothetical protein